MLPATRIAAPRHMLPGLLRAHQACSAGMPAALLRLHRLRSTTRLYRTHVDRATDSASRPVEDEGVRVFVENPENKARGQRKVIKKKTSVDHREGGLYVTALVSFVFLGTIAVWYVKGVMYGNNAVCTFDTLEARMLIEKVFLAHPEYAPMAIQLVWLSNSAFLYNKPMAERHACSGQVDTSLPCFAAMTGLLKALDGVREDLHAEALDTLKEGEAAPQQITRSDLWAFAACVAVQFLGGPAVPFKFGRVDGETAEPAEASDIKLDVQETRSLRRAFYRGAMTDIHLTALMCLHNVGKTHASVSGIPDGSRWSPSAKPKVSNEYYINLLNTEWVPSSCGKFYRSKKDASVICLKADHLLLEDEMLRSWCKKFAEDSTLLNDHLISAMSELLNRPHAPWGPVAY